VSDYSLDRAVLVGLLGRLSELEKELFKMEVQNQLGLAAGEDCDSICGAMGDEEFSEFIECIKEALLRKKRRFAEVGQHAAYA
jgi:hypothetical protein